MVEKEKLSIESIVNDYADDLFRFAYSKTFDKEISEDLVQDTLIVAIEKSDKFRGDSSPKTWLISILKNKISDFYRKKKKESLVDEEVVDISNSFTDKGSWKDYSSVQSYEDAGPLLNDAEFSKVFYNCIENLPEMWRSVMKMKYVNPVKSKEICKELEISDTNLWQIVHRSKLKLKGCIEHNWFNKQNA